MTKEQNNADNATLLLEQALAVVEGSFYRLRDEVLTADELHDMRIRLDDATDAIGVACRYIDQLQYSIDTESAQ